MALELLCSDCIPSGMPVRWDRYSLCPPCNINKSLVINRLSHTLAVRENRFSRTNH